MSNAELSNRRDTAVARGVGMQTQVYAERALNSEVWDVEGNRYIDFAAGIAVVNTGHCHPKILDAVQKQAASFTHTCHQVMPYANYIRLAERLNEKVPGDFEKKTIFVTTGAEAVENAVKIARAATNRPAVIAFGGAFHGRTFMGMTLTGKVAPYKKGFGAMMPDVYHVPFPIDLHGTSTEDALGAITKLFKSDLDPERVAAIIIEPVQGEGGFYPAPAELMRGLRALCDEHGIIMVADEVQTGFARTGNLFAMDGYDVCADITTMAKGLAGGLPLAAVTGRADIMDAAAPGGLGGTYGGNPLGIAAANAVLDVIEEEDLCNRANELGSRLKQRLESIRERTPEIVDIRGPGFMIAAELNTADGSAPNPEMANAVRAEALSRGLVLLTCGVYGNVIRFLAPLTVQDDIFAEAMDILEASIDAVKGH
ncbi:4-aminobutyrate--2-oxoglutarate transaminase [Shimia thalassica]|uniref:4-aminobutyrate--2-oxoglutarate transaminase n=1 Tax=Shimia thalassica TaxID=1715693 RepID=UPI000C0840D3|nr:4-aminobutyrate--2-oxoglutarate transaminase [Shimia thalassica]PHO05292.1 4-aminobutyrate--2-oxoglutarate transaminase [Rhodobacteraceae bacterium 4F10]MBU2942607.1 4-aminobutyrate--2-oxoglutarate transaminase [Shimia thalassica]MDO6481029.1 4-aminobutyrate--2-oxoglutarate transaminase [Shimia thalassica]MDO6504538.1 4-aminobutyrate--2-oxoglutarate transaminase [Shimia thalassica]MDP2519748.1 4-aminobutyrate--2-oxoglutarate transaminase [Shimia thalassica]